MHKRTSVTALVASFLGAFGLSPAIGQVGEPAPVFKPALEEIGAQARIPIVLPSKLPSVIAEREIKLSSGEVFKDGYFISLYYEETGSNATYAAGFSGSTRIFHDLPNTQRVSLSGGRSGLFRPVSCGGSCAPANLWWVQDGVMYQIQIKLLMISEYSGTFCLLARLIRYGKPERSAARFRGVGAAPDGRCGAVCR